MILFQIFRRLQFQYFVLQGDSDHLIYLCLETVAAGHSVLIFCPTKNWCESLAMSVAEEFRTIGKSSNLHFVLFACLCVCVCNSEGVLAGVNRDPNAPESLPYKLRQELDANAIMQTLEQLKRCPAGLDDLLARTVSFGVSFHHAGEFLCFSSSCTPPWFNLKFLREKDMQSCLPITAQCIWSEI